jgi:hypothetical protein
MFKYLTLATGAMSQMQPMGNSFAPPAAPVQVAQPMGGMDPMMMMLLLNDNKDSSDSSLKKLLPLMMMQGGNMGGMDPMMMMLMLDDDSSSSDDSLSSLLPLMMMNGGMGGAGAGQAAGGMNPMMMMLLMDDDCKYTQDFKGVTDANKKAIAEGTKFTIKDAATTVDADVKAFPTDAAEKKLALKNVDYKYLRCTKKGGSGMSDLLPLMMMGGQGGAMGGMDPMMMMLLMDDSSSDMSDMLPLMMMNGGMGGQPGQAGAMNPMMLMLLGDDDKKEKAACYRKYEVAHAIDAAGAKKTAGADIVAVIEAMKADPTLFGLPAGALPAGYLKDFSDCIVAAGTTVGDYSKTKSSTDKLLPLMMMGGMGGQGGAAMDPMMMMLLLKD